MLGLRFRMGFRSGCLLGLDLGFECHIFKHNTLVRKNLKHCLAIVPNPVLFNSGQKRSTLRVNNIYCILKATNSSHILHEGKSIPIDLLPTPEKIQI